MDELTKAFKEAWSLENRQAHTSEESEIKQIGAIDEGNRRYILFRDTSGAYWYRTLIKVNDTYLPEQEAIFGAKKKPGRQPRQIHR